MSVRRLLSLLCAAVSILGIAIPALAAQVDCDAVYCFTAQDFSPEETPVAGICITGLPDPETGTVLLGNRVLRRGDILSAQQLSEMTFSPLRTELDSTATVTYLPIYENRVAPATTMCISIRGKEDHAPIAEDMTLETYKNVPNEGVLKVKDPEGQAMQYTVVRSPRRGQVMIAADGSFTYTPKKNKVGVDTFTYTATDSTGNVSREATVTVQILNPTDSRQYTDTAGLSCRFEAEWLRNTGLFTGETVSGQHCFFPEKAVSRGDFLAMLVNVLDIPTQDADYSSISEDVPQWLKSYVGAAMRSGLMDGWPEKESGLFEAQMPITGAEAAVMVQNALDLTLQASAELPQDVPAWAADSLAVMEENGMALGYDQPLSRADAALLLYRVHQLSVTAPGTNVFRMQ